MKQTSDHRPVVRIMTEVVTAPAAVDLATIWVPVALEGMEREVARQTEQVAFIATLELLFHKEVSRPLVRIDGHHFLALRPQSLGRHPDMLNTVHHLYPWAHQIYQDHL